MWTALLLSSAIQLLLCHAGTSRGRLLLPRRAIARTRGLTTGGIAGARRALPRGALELKAGAGVHHRRTAGVDGGDDVL